MKIAISTYSFSRLLANGTITQLDCIEKAKEMGFDAIEFVGVIPHDGSSEESYATLLGEEARRFELPVTNYTVGADFLSGSGGNLNAEIKKIKHSVDIAVLLGASGMRHDATMGFVDDTRGFLGFDDALPRLAQGCLEVTEYAAERNIKTMIENHGFFCQDSERIEKLVNKVAHKNFGLLLDMGNFLCVDENPSTAFGRTAPYAFYVHAKDFHVKSGCMPNPGEGFFNSRGGNYLRGTIIGHGDVPIKECLMALNQVEYNGHIAIEFEGMEETLQGIKIGLTNLRRYISDIFK